jgi:hypothetical protein
MKKIIIICFLFLNSCATVEYTPPQPNFVGMTGGYHYQIFLKTRSFGCEADLIIENISSGNKTVYVELTVFDNSDTNIDMTNLIISSLGKYEKAKRNSYFPRTEYCSRIKKMRIQIKSY